jgi:hypothetical protein
MVKKSGNGGVTNEKIMEVLLDMDKKVDVLDSRLEIQGRRSGRLENRMVGVEGKIKRFETQIEKHMSVFEERMDEMEGALKNVVEWGAAKADLKEFATKNDIERATDEILRVLAPIIKAVDKDAETVVDYGKRIIIPERKTGLAVK